MHCLWRPMKSKMHAVQVQCACPRGCCRGQGRAMPTPGTASAITHGTSLCATCARSAPPVYPAADAERKGTADLTDVHMPEWVHRQGCDQSRAFAGM